MILECWVIIIIIFLMAFMYFRVNKMNYAVSVLPLMVVPLLHLASSPLSRLLSDVVPITPGHIRVYIDLLGLMIACFLFGGLSRNIKGKLARRGYIIVCGVFTAILTCILIFSLISPILAR